jgi:hypothetical protein
MLVEFSSNIQQPIFFGRQKRSCMLVEFSSNIQRGQKRYRLNCVLVDIASDMQQQYYSDKVIYSRKILFCKN